MGILYAKQTARHDAGHKTIPSKGFPPFFLPMGKKHDKEKVFWMIIFFHGCESLTINCCFVLKSFFRGDIEKQLLLEEMVSLSGNGGGREVMMKLLSIIVS